MAIKGVLRNIVYVDDMAKMVAFYRDILGLPLNYPHKDDYSRENWVEFQAGTITIALHGGGKSEATLGAPKIVFEVNDIEVEHQRLEEAGVKLTDICEVAPGVHSADGWDAEGNYFSIDYHEH
jgi:predicted enzyme related to lactoylglutathione lyase